MRACARRCRMARFGERSGQLHVMACNWKVEGVLRACARRCRMARFDERSGQLHVMACRGGTT